MRTVVLQKNDKVEWLDQRYYKVNDEVFFPSVTTILEAYPKPAALFEWLKENGKNSDELRDAAADVGSNVHKAIEDYDEGKEICWADSYGRPQYSLMEWQLICRYVAFAQKVNYELISNETSYCSNVLMYGGTIDKVCAFNGKVWLIDNKTSNSIYDSHWLQLSAYKKLWEEFNPTIKIDNVAILHLKAQTRTEGKGDAIQGPGWKLCMPDKPLEYYDSLFDATYKLWHAQNPSAKPLNRVFPAMFKRQTEAVAV